MLCGVLCMCMAGNYKKMSFYTINSRPLPQATIMFRASLNCAIARDFEL